MMEHTAEAERDLIAVTGATGFIGSHLVSRLDAQQRPTRALIRTKKNRPINLPSTTEIVAGSLQDHESIMALLAGAKTCVHLAGATTAIDVNGFHTANVIGSYNMAACALKAGIEHFIYVSSQAARAPLISDYAASKAMSEIALSAFAAEMRITIIRPPAVIGAGDPMLQPMFDLIRVGWLPAPAEPKRAPRAFAVISVEDLVTQIIETIDRPPSDEPLLEPCSVASTHWSEVASAVSRVVDRKVRVVRIWPALMMSLGFCADALAKLTRRPLSVSRNKVRELLAVDWTYDQPVRNAMTLSEVFAASLGEDRPK